MNVTTISSFRKQTKRYFDEVIDNDDTLLITRGDGRTVVLTSLNQYNAQSETDYLNSNPANKKYLEESIRQLRTGKLERHDLAED
jgi:antitoxin YefM